MNLKTLSRFLVPALLVWVLVAGLWLSWHMSMTTDEGIHTASGYLALTRGEQRFDPEHPILFKYFTALPLVVMHPNLPPDDAQLWENAKPTGYDSWAEARLWTEEWFYKSGNNGKLMIFLARIPAVLALVGLCALTYYLATLWFGKRFGLWALFFTAFNPTLLAHAATTNDDVPLALASMLALWALWAFWEKPAWRTVLLSALGLAVAINTKFSGIYLIPVVFCWFIYTGITKKISAKTIALYLLSGALATLIATWAFYFFKSPVYIPETGNGSTINVLYVPFIDNMTFRHIAQVLRFIVPSAFLKGLVLTLGSSIGGRATWLLDKGYSNGVWFYFPVLFLLKTQIIALALGVGAAWMAFRKNIKTWQPATVLIAITSIIFVILAVKSKLDIGIRHITPALTLFSFACAAALIAFQDRFKWKFAGTVIVLLYVLPVLIEMPYLIGFSNIFIPNKADTFKYFSDSNLDWGQQAEHIADYVRDNLHNETVYLNYFWSPYAVQYYGASILPFDAKGPLNGEYVVSAIQLTSDDYVRFRDAKPLAELDPSTFVYSFRNNQSIVQ